METRYYITIFKSKNHAMQVYYTLEKLGYKKFQLISTPCEIKAGCSYSIKFFDLDDFKIVKEVSTRLNIIIESLYRIQRKDKKKTNNNLSYLI